MTRRVIPRPGTYDVEVECPIEACTGIVKVSVFVESEYADGRVETDYVYDTTELAACCGHGPFVMGSELDWALFVAIKTAVQDMEG